MGPKTPGALGTMVERSSAKRMIAGSNPDVSIDVFSFLIVSVDMYSKINSSLIQNVFNYVMDLHGNFTVLFAQTCYAEFCDNLTQLDDK